MESFLINVREKKLVFKNFSMIKLLFIKISQKEIFF